jgi:anaerobic selenocysteine-containing dehydrogenase
MAESVAPIILRGACPHDCPGTCAWQVTVENGVAVKLVGNATHVITRRGHCTKINPNLGRVSSTERVQNPLRRSGRRADRLSTVSDRHSYAYKEIKKIKRGGVTHLACL